MKLNLLAVTGSPMFLHRHRFLFDVLRTYIESVIYITGGDISTLAALNRLTALAYNVTSRLARPIAQTVFDHNAFLFAQRSRIVERKLSRLKNPPDLVFHMFGMYRPSWDRGDLPYVMYLDYTTALGRKVYPAWAPFRNGHSLAAWLACEERAYHGAQKVFTMSGVVRDSLVSDYGVPKTKIRVVGASGMFMHPYEGEKKTFGTRQLLFNGTAFHRKGGDLLIEACQLVRRRWPTVTVAILGGQRASTQEGIKWLGYVSNRQELEKLFLQSDLVIAPARCDPFPGFVIEAMNYGVPCIVSGVDGMPEIVDHGRAGIVLDRTTAKDIAEAIENLLPDTSRLERMSHNGREIVRSKLNWPRVAEAVLGELHQLP